ncbi:MAG: shikimate kinase [Tissierellia bacterium]|nr:shikimate kinase [Tissierellia bacterium]
MNLVLIGMPGCGKTTLAKELQREMGWEMMDTDEMVVRWTGRRIADLFSISEERFRQEETKTLKRIMSLYDKKIIATGGGVVERRKNREILHKGGFVVFIHRELDEIKSLINYSRRPLLKEGREQALEELYQRRLPLYRDFCHMEVAMDRTIFQMARYLKEELKRKEIGL